MTEMHDVVEMLLSRMKDYPEDFINADAMMMGRPNKWQRALNIINEVVTQEEKNALALARQEAKRAIHMGAALKTILSDEEPEEDKPYMTMKTQGRYAVQPTSIEGSSSLMSKLEARVKAQEAQMQRQYALSEYNNSFSVSGSALG